MTPLKQDSAASTSGAAGASGAEASQYFTDGVNLFRALGWLDDGPAGLVILEDCYSLVVLLVESDEAARLEIVPCATNAGCASRQRSRHRWTRTRR